jgi:acetate kinase
VPVLCFNAGSSSLRLAAYRERGASLESVLAVRSVSPESWRTALPEDFLPGAVVHRIVRGVKTDVAAEPFSAEVEAEIRSASALAPTHDPKALALLAESAAAFPRARQYVAYDTAFHASIPVAHSTYAIPEAWRAQGIRRIGYHGLSCAYAAQWLAAQVPAPKRAVHAHLGNGCSVTGLIDGRSAATTMGFTPLEGLVMGTRSGSIDPGALLFLLQRGMNAAEISGGLYRESGLRALCGTNDMREIEQRRAQGDGEAELAFHIFTESVSGAIAAIATAIGGVETVTLSGGIGFHSTAVRERVCANLSWLGAGSRFAVHALDVQEERMMAAAMLEAQLKHPRGSGSPRT